MKWFMNLKTSAKLISGFCIVALIVGCVGLYAMTNLGMMNDNINAMYTNNLTSIQNLSAAQISYSGMRIGIRDMSTADTKEKKDAIEANDQALQQDIESRIDVYRNTPLTDEEKQELKIFDAKLPEYKKLFDQAAELAYKDDRTAFVAFKDGELLAAGNALDASLSKLIELNVKLADQKNADSKDAFYSARGITIGVIIAAFLISILLGIFIARSISRPLNTMVAIVEKVAQGDLRETAAIDTKDEIGRLAASLNAMTGNLKSLIGGVVMSAQSVAAASEQISASTEEIAGSSSNQAESAQSISEMFKELNSAINLVALSAEHAAELSGKTVEAAGEGDRVVRQSVAGMEEVRRKMGRLEEDSLRIGEIIEVIDDIADQTNLLALNAAIEAARAGDQGRGFAVVADEVRKLAERSSEATKQISSIIKAMQDNTRQSVTAVMSSAEQSIQTGDSFRTIIDMVNQSSSKVNEIAAACEEEAAQATDVMQSVELIAASSEEAAAASEETAVTCQSLAQLADELNKSVSTFKL